MTVGELIGALSKLEQDAPVKIWDYDMNEGWWLADVELALVKANLNLPKKIEVVIT